MAANRSWRRWTAQELEILRKEYPRLAANGRTRELANLIKGRNHAAIRQKAKDIGLAWADPDGPGFRVEPIPTVNRSVAELLEAQVSTFDRKKDRAEAKRSGIRIEMADPGPYAIAFLGDPHADDSGFDVEGWTETVKTVRETPHMYGACMGDLTNNWIGKLARLYGHQPNTEDEGAKLCEWVVSCLPWLFVILGNHDKWGPLAQSYCERAGVSYVSHGGVFELFAGEHVLRIDARHDHRGRSQYDPAFAQGKRHYRGSRADIIIGAHIHQGAYSLRRNGVTGHLAHCLRVGSFKKYDEYVDSSNFDADDVGPVAVFTVDTSCEPERGVQHWTCPARAGEYLAMLRARG